MFSSKECHDLLLYKKMVTFVMAYSFTEPPEEKGDKENDSEEEEEEAEEEEEEKDSKSAKNPPMMVPMADVLNHATGNNAHLDFGEAELKMIAIKSIKKVGSVTSRNVSEVLLF